MEAAHADKVHVCTEVRTVPFAACTHLRLLNSTRVCATQQGLPAMQRDAASRKKTEADKEIEILNFEVRSTCVICAPTVAM